MNYFTSGIHGNYDIYKKLKKLVVDPEDHLWILGDILDGNSARPAECFRIVDDIQYSRNIHLILGDHDFFHVMRVLSMDEPETSEAWEENLKSSFISGEPLLNYMAGLDEDNVLSVIHTLSQSDVSDMIKIGDRVFYLCHGAPSLRSLIPGGEMPWQYNVATAPLIMSDDYTTEIASDINIQRFSEKFGGIDLKKVFIVSGTSVEEGLNTGGKDMSGIAFANRKFCIGQECSADNPPESFKVLAFDAAGYYTIDICNM